MTILYTTQVQLRKAFRQEHPYLSFKKISNGTMFCTDTRCAWVDWIDYLSKSGEISQELAERATL